MIKLIFLFNNYLDFFNDQYLEIKYNSSKIYLSPILSYWIHFCKFENFTSKAISILTSNIINFYIENSYFYYCNDNSVGGAINIINNGGSTILNKICSFFCSSNGNYAGFCYSKTQNNNKNEIYLSSFGFTYLSNGPIWFQYGIQKINFINSSYNSGNAYSGLLFDYPNIGNLTFSTILNTSSINYISIGFWKGNGFIFNSNIFNNYQGLSSYGIIMVETNFLKIYSSIINKNSIFLFYGNSIELNNCYIQNLYSSTSIINNNPQISSNTLLLTKIQFHDCLNFFYLNTQNKNNIVQKLLFYFTFSFLIF